jgi:large subunit ribosomal protein L29
MKAKARNSELKKSGAKEQFNLRMQRGTGHLTRPSQMRVVRRDIARVKTAMNQNKAGGAQ